MGICIDKVVFLAYADDITLIAPSVPVLQSMITHYNKYGYIWQYLINAAKSAIMVRGESTTSHKVARSSHNQLLGDLPIINEVDDYKHLGITLSISGSSLLHTSQSISSARSAFYALQSVGPRFGCLHPLTSLKSKLFLYVFYSLVWRSFFLLKVSC